MNTVRKIQTRVNEIFRMALQLDRPIERIDDIIDTDDLRRQRQSALFEALSKSQFAIDKVSQLADDIVADVMVVQAHQIEKGADSNE